MNYFIHKEPLKYDGTQLSSLWAFRTFKIQGDSIISFCGECEVSLEHMVDLADVLNQDTIYSEKMAHFIIEHFDLELEKTILRQRLIICIIKEIIEGYGHRLSRSGDDLYQNNKKLSVSIATLSRISSLIHIGVNISSANTPVPTISLDDLQIDAGVFRENVVMQYMAELNSIKLARCKVRGVD
ncbi:MAG: DUF366 family protein [Clostridia bacterium]|jgi:hypothetical protein|nr:DUF366 family protein [Clostridia bacterium]